MAVKKLLTTVKSREEGKVIAIGSCEKLYSSVERAELFSLVQGKNIADKMHSEDYKPQRKYNLTTHITRK